VADGSLGIDGTAALSPKVGLVIQFPPNPLVELRDMTNGQGLGLVCGAGGGYCAEGTATPG